MLPDLPPESPPETPPAVVLKMSTELRRNNVLAGQHSAPTVHCFSRAAERHGLDPLVLLAVLKVEGGRPGELALNTNGTVDLGPMSVNTVWLPVFAKRMGLPEAETRRRLAADGCANVAAAAFILKEKIASTGSLWEGVAHFHSANPRLQGPYLTKVHAAFESIVRRFASGLR
jgi:hypothetical protein